MSVSYQLQDDGQFVIQNYQFSKPFCSFLPGVAGLNGIPMWCFYVNRGQGVCALGVENRENMIMEFMPADQAYQRTSQIGFRTFYKVRKHDIYHYYEAFKNDCSDFVEQKMLISAEGVSFVDVNTHLGLETTVSYCTLPNDDFPALIRRIAIKNISDVAVNFEVLDGLPKIMPFGMNEFFCKNMSRTSEAWMSVQNLEEQHAPFYKLKVIPLDAAKVVTLKKGNFFLCLRDGQRIKPIVDPTTVFGPNVDFSYPYHFYQPEPFMFPAQQMTDNRTPCAMMHYETTLDAGQEMEFEQIIGQIASLDVLQSEVERISTHNFIQGKVTENRSVIQSIVNPVITQTNSKKFDYYHLQTYLDNVLRGGMPIQLVPGQKDSPIFYVYSRKHGDLERDYNKYNIAPTPYSQGNGNYRDVNQNRRSDIFVTPELGRQGIMQMMNLIQLDGYNPLNIKGLRYQLSSAKKKALLAKQALNLNTVVQVLQDSFSPGELMMALRSMEVTSEAIQKLFYDIMQASTVMYEADHQEGFWSDHWHYNLDLIESYLSVFPDQAKAMFFEDSNYLFYDDAYVVLPRSERYGIDETGLVRQLQFVASDNEKARLISNRSELPHAVHVTTKKDTVYNTNLVVKILHLILIKACTIDAFGAGIEMEGGKPNWYDAINGLPALFGSATSELFELKRWTQFLNLFLDSFKTKKVHLPIELAEVFQSLQDLLTNYDNQENRDFWYWDKSNTIKEIFRAKTRLGLSGKETTLKCQSVQDFCDALVSRIDHSIHRAKDESSGVYYTYLRYEVFDYTHDSVSKAILIKSFRQIPLPLFLEGPVHYLRTVNNVDEAYCAYCAIRSSSLFDQELNMYKVNSSLAAEPIEIGRNKIFSPGWLENESIWLHMEYKYLLELLRSGLNREFEQVFRDVVVAFQNPERYGRSILENSSFIASSANPDPATHGQGFVARLSGSTAEWIHIWRLMCFGSQPFQVDGRQLVFAPVSKIPGWLFTETEQIFTYQSRAGKTIQEKMPAGAMLATFLGSIPVFFINLRRVHTWDTNVARIVVDGSKKILMDVSDSKVIGATKIRNREVEKITIYFS